MVLKKINIKINNKLNQFNLKINQINIIIQKIFETENSMEVLINPILIMISLVNH